MELHYGIWDYHSQLPLKREVIKSTESQEAVFFFKQRKWSFLKEWHKTLKKKIYPHQNGDNKLQTLLGVAPGVSASLLACESPSEMLTLFCRMTSNHPHDTVQERCCLSRAVSDPLDLVTMLTADTPWGILIFWPCANTLLYLNAGHICLWWACDKTWVAVTE